MNRSMIMLLVSLALVIGACSSAAPADDVPPVASEVNKVKQVEKPGAPGESTDDDFGSFEVPEEEGSAEADDSSDVAEGDNDEEGSEAGEATDSDDADSEASEDANADDAAAEGAEEADGT